MVGARLCWPLTEPQDTSRNIFDWRQSSWWQQMTVPSGLTIKINYLSVTKRKRNKFNLVPFFPKRCCWRQSRYLCYWQTCHTVGLPILSLSVGGHTRFWHGQVGQCNVATVPAKNTSIKQRQLMCPLFMLTCWVLIGELVTCCLAWTFDDIVVAWTISVKILNLFRFKSFKSSIPLMSSRNSWYEVPSSKESIFINCKFTCT